MQGKEVSEQETRKCSAGIDVSKDWLDAHVLPTGESLRLANTSEGIRQLKRWLLRLNVERVAIEATGKWHRAVFRSLSASNIAVAVVDPFRVRMFAKAQRIAAKTDRLDAKVLAMYAAMMSPVCRPPAPELLEALQELVTARASAVDEKTALKNQFAAATQLFLKSQLRKRIKQLEAHVDALEKECLARIEAEEGLKRRFDILTSIPGVGNVVAITLIACLSELGFLSDKQAAALAGLAPIAHDSGQHQGVRVIWGGRSAVRRALFLAALSAKTCNKEMNTFFLRLADKGKAKKAALIAVARKLVVLANLLIAQDRPWQKIAPKCA
jgi:transposase